MGFFIRIINKKHYDKKLKRFTSLSFKPSSNGGISVIDKECVLHSTGCVCDHIQRYYGSVSGDPPIYWEIPPNLLPENCEFQQTPSASGDDCHHNILNVTNQEAREILLKSNMFAEFYLCENKECSRLLCEKDLDLFKGE